ncbi:MAG: hypothetical protein GY758_09045 [Fuerstiella sp.]|nr:hypothetical protein [Fuerstiella sp.]
MPKVSVFGLMGETGASKTTLLKHVPGLLRSSFGSISVFGPDPVDDGPQYSEDRSQRRHDCRQHFPG